MRMLLLFMVLLIGNLWSQALFDELYQGRDDFPNRQSHREFFRHHYQGVDRLPFSLTTDGQAIPLPSINGIIKDDYLVNDDTSGGAWQYFSSIASDALGNYVVVWIDERNGYGDIYAQRYNSAGQPLGSNFRVNDDLGSVSQYYPSVSMDGSGNFVAVWEDGRNGDWDIYAQRYNSGGQPLGSNFQVNDDIGSTWIYYPSIGMDGSGNFIVCWMDPRNSNWDIYAQRYNSGGQPLGSNFRVDDDVGGASQEFPSVSMNGSGNFVVAWQDLRNGNWDIYAQRYNSAGQTLGSNFRLNDDVGGASQESPSISMNGSGNFVAVWEDGRNGDSDIYGQHYNSVGQPLGSNFRVNDDVGSAEQWYPSISMDGLGSFVVSWADNRNGDYDIYAQRYNSSGLPQGSNFQVNDDIGSAEQWYWYPSVSMDGLGSFVVSWADNRNGDYDIYAQRYNSAGQTLGNNFRVNDFDVDNVKQWIPSVSKDGSGNFVVAWADGRGGDDDIYAQRYNSAGQLLGSNFRVNDDMGNDWQVYPSVSVNGSGNFVVAWLDERNGDSDIYAQRYNSVGQPLGSNFLVNDDGGGIVYNDLPSVSIDMIGNFVIVWDDNRNGSDDIFAQRYNNNGQALGSNFMVNEWSNAYQGNPSLGMDDNGNFVIVWEDWRNYDQDIYAQCYDASGQPLGSNFRVNDDVGSASQSYPSISKDGSGNFVVAWMDERNGNSDIYAQRYNSAGQALGSNFRVNDDVGSAWQYYPSASMDGSGNFVVAWEDYRYNLNDPYIIGQRYDFNGNPIGSNYIIVDGTDWHSQIFPAIAANDTQIVFTWMDNRRAKGWDIYAKIATWDWDGVTAINENNVEIPSVFFLEQNYPNPFNPVTHIRYALLQAGKVKLDVYNSISQQVAVLVNERKSAGYYVVEFDGRDLSSGIYFYKIQVRDPSTRSGQGFQQVRKMLLVK